MDNVYIGSFQDPDTKEVMFEISVYVEDYGEYKFYDLYFFIYENAEAIRMIDHWFVTVSHWDIWKREIALRGAVCPFEY